MKRVILSVMLIVMLLSVPAFPEDYDPQHTMLALNMAIVSVHKIVTAKDRITLDQ